MYRIAVLVSGTGSNFMSIAKAIQDGHLSDVEITVVISDKEGAPALDHADQLGIPTLVLDRKIFKEELSNEIDCILKEMGGVDLVVLAGFLSILQGDLLKEYAGRMINIHPSLIPAFCGDGMYGLRVHQAAIDYGVKVSGCTVHLVSEETDGGPIVLQKVVPVKTEDAKKLQQAVLEKEHEAIVEAVSLFAKHRVSIEGRHVRVVEA